MHTYTYTRVGDDQRRGDPGALARHGQGQVRAGKDKLGRAKKGCE